MKLRSFSTHDGMKYNTLCTRMRDKKVRYKIGVINEKV